MDVLLEETYARLAELADRVAVAQRRLARSRAALACTVRVIALLLRCRFSLGDAEHASLVAHLQPDVADDDDCYGGNGSGNGGVEGGGGVDGSGIGWEESVDAAMTHLLRTALAKSAKDEGAAAPAATVAAPDTNRLKKHLGIVCARISAGACLVSGS
ncbi:unnamed protein product, partial [Phaeothamnion confervicola]